MPIEEAKVSYELDLTEKLKKVKPSKRKEAKELIGNYLLDAIFNDTSSAKSPVTGQQFVPLQSKSYKALKKKKGKGTRANLRLNEKMLPDLKARNTIKGVKLEITKKKEKAKAFNHITGDTKGMAARPFLPNDNGEAVKPKGKGSDQFRTSIVKGIDSILEDFL